MTEDSYRPRAVGGCICADWPERKLVPLGGETADFLDEEFLRVRDRNPWLSLVRCRGCRHAWYAAVDTVDDDYYFRRLTSDEVDAIATRDQWPADYDRFINVWPGSQELWRGRVERPIGW